MPPFVSAPAQPGPDPGKRADDPVSGAVRLPPLLQPPAFDEHAGPGPGVPVQAGTGAGGRQHPDHAQQRRRTPRPGHRGGRHLRGHGADPGAAPRRQMAPAGHRGLPGGPGAGPQVPQIPLHCRPAAGPSGEVQGGPQGDLCSHRHREFQTVGLRPAHRQLPDVLSAHPGEAPQRSHGARGAKTAGHRPGTDGTDGVLHEGDGK